MKGLQKISETIEDKIKSLEFDINRRFAQMDIMRDQVEYLRDLLDVVENQKKTKGIKNNG